MIETVLTLENDNSMIHIIQEDGNEKKNIKIKMRDAVIDQDKNCAEINLTQSELRALISLLKNTSQLNY